MHLCNLEPVPLVRALLLALLKERPKSTGYDLMKGVEDVSQRTVSISSGTTYAELRRLERLKFVTSERDKTGRRRREYILTDSGRIELENLVTIIESRIELILKPLIQLVRNTK
ncbi:PadR family transcriptional regulator [Candidatus Thorarchaeota archaeon]|nr:MAG: PadR family transcriptional regulator [Candidatus Thorarchaeota archaeon]